MNTKSTKFHSKYPKVCAHAHTHTHAHTYAESQTNTEITLW